MRARATIGAAEGVVPRCLVAACAIVALAARAHAQAAAPAATGGIDPVYIGSLLAPNPALSTAGALVIQPTVLYAIQTGTFGANGRAVDAARSDALQSSTSIRYALTDRITAQVIPTTSAIFGPAGFNSGSQPGDTALEVDYLLLRGDDAGRPKVSASVGVDVPTGRFERLATTVDGSGDGAYRARLGIIGQTVLLGDGAHPVRLRVYANGEIPLAGVSLHGISTYGTDAAFNGSAMPGVNGSFGAALEYSVTRTLVFAFDVYHGFNTAACLRGVETGGLPITLRDGGADGTQVAPALEYSLSDKLGVVAGVALGVAGHGSARLVSPQIELSIGF